METVADLVETIADERRRDDARLLIALMGEVTGEEAALWPSKIVGFGTRHYRYESGREGDTIAVGFAPRTPHTVLYLTGSLDSDYVDLLARFGPYTRSKGCVYVKRVDQADQAVLREMIDRSYRAATASSA